jgi:hypothetical protein
MILTYIDESGTPDLPGNTSHYVLAGLSIPIWKWKSCEKEVNQIKAIYNLTNAEIHTAWLLRPYLEQAKIPGFENMNEANRKYESQKYRNAELLRLQKPATQKQYHRTKKFYNQTKDYIHLTWNERKAFVTDIAKLIGSWDFARLFAEAVDKIHFNPAIAKGTVDEQAFEQLVSRFEQYLRIYTKSSHRKIYGILIHDNNDTVSKRHTELMKQFHRSGTFWTTLNNIIETPLFVDSQLTSMIQLADVCSYSIRRYVEKGEDFLFNEVFRIADKKNDKVVGVRHFTDSSCQCNICQSHR